MGAWGRRGKARGPGKRDMAVPAGDLGHLRGGLVGAGWLGVSIWGLGRKAHGRGPWNT